MTLLEGLGDFLASPRRGYGFAIHEVKEMLAEVRLLLEHELDFRREQATLGAKPPGCTAPALAFACRG